MFFGSGPHDTIRIELKNQSGITKLLSSKKDDVTLSAYFDKISHKSVLEFKPVPHSRRSEATHDPEKFPIATVVPVTVVVE